MGMGIILSALSGAGQGINQVGVEQAKNIDEINKADMIARNNYQRLEENRQKDAAILNAAHSNLKEQYLNKNLPAPAPDAAPDVLDKYNQAKQAASEKFDADPMNRVHAAINAGQIEHAAALAKIHSEGNKVIPYGGLQVDASGNIIRDNSIVRAENDTFRSHKLTGSGLASGSSDRNYNNEDKRLEGTAEAYRKRLTTIAKELENASPEKRATLETERSDTRVLWQAAMKQVEEHQKKYKENPSGSAKPTPTPNNKADYSNLF